MNETAYFIKDRALALVGDAKIHPATYPAAINWLDLAHRWAEARDITELVKAVVDAKIAIFTHATAPNVAA